MYLLASPLYDPDMSLAPGQKFAGYSIISLLGRGGMGEVYLAQHPRLPRQDALKLLGQDISTDGNFRGRFLREADLASTLWHPHIVGVHDRGDDDGRLWISMDFVDGQDASRLLSSRYPAGFPQELVISIVSAMGSALDYAHRQGLLHRDVKPANIMLADTGEDEQRILLTDFGIARERDDSSGLTSTNMTMGTVAYAAPEQLMGEVLDGRADQYALAATAYHLLTGTTLFAHTNAAVVISRHLNVEAPRLADVRPDLAALDPVLSAALAKDPDCRFGRCGDFAQALAEQASRNRKAPTPFAPTTPAPIATRFPRVAESRDGSRKAAGLMPGWYPDPEGGSGTLYWDGNSWHSASPQTSDPAAPSYVPAGKARIRVTLVAWATLFIVVMGTLAVGGVVWLKSQDLVTSLPSETPVSEALTAASMSSPTESPTHNATSSSSPPRSSVVTSATQVAPTSQQQRVWLGVVTGTCDEGSSCGVRQRAAPFSEAPSLYPTDLRDGTPISVSCQTIGDLRSSQGHGASRIWLKLSNDSYINSVYVDMQASGVPMC